METFRSYHSCNENRRKFSHHHHLPLTPPVYNVLLALGEEPLHGYAIIQEFERKTGQVGALLPGSLYNTIARMLKLGVIDLSSPY